MLLLLLCFSCGENPHEILEMRNSYCSEILLFILAQMQRKMDVLVCTVKKIWHHVIAGAM